MDVKLEAYLLVIILVTIDQRSDAIGPLQRRISVTLDIRVTANDDFLLELSLHLPAKIDIHTHTQRTLICTSRLPGSALSIIKYG